MVLVSDIDSAPSPTTTFKPNLQTIPAELLQIIVSYACTDGGQTGCSLNLVSKVFRQICSNGALDIRLALVCGHHRLERFLGVLHCRAEGMRRVESLFMSYRSRRDTHELRQGESEGASLAFVYPFINATHSYSSRSPDVSDHIRYHAPNSADYIRVSSPNPPRRISSVSAGCDNPCVSTKPR